MISCVTPKVRFMFQGIHLYKTLEKHISQKKRNENILMTILKFLHFLVSLYDYRPIILLREKLKSSTLTAFI